jgi:hypothetical protein
MFVAPRDRTFGRSALKEFGPSYGILDVYPLEVVTHVLDHYPHFLPKVSRGTFFHQSGERAQVWHTDTQTPVILEYPEDLKVRGFALIGGGTPGYVFEPSDVPGRYRLQVRSPGRWTCSVSGVSRITRWSAPTTARAREVGMPSAAIASEHRNSRIEERSTARPSALRE